MTSNFAYLKQAINIAVFASGSGSNAQVLIEHFSKVNNATVALVVGNRKNAGVWARAEALNVPTLYLSKEDLGKPSTVEMLQEKDIDLIVLAGFLLKIPLNLIAAYSGRIINIHPALLPKYGGKGMYGKHVHQAVIDHKDEVSGITIHLVNEEYDKGRILAQHSCTLSADETVESLQEKVHKLEHAHFAKCVQEYIDKEWI